MTDDRLADLMQAVTDVARIAGTVPGHAGLYVPRAVRV